MTIVSARKGALTVQAYVGDAKTLLAFNLTKARSKRLAGFTIACEPSGLASYYLFNELQFQYPGKHSQNSAEPAYSSINAPIHKFRWVHVPGSSHQGLSPQFGQYTYTVTPRYFDAKASLVPLDATLSATVSVDVKPFVKGSLELGFTRGFTQSQAFINHFGRDAKIEPSKPDLLFDTTQIAGTNASGVSSTFAEAYQWMGFTAREKIFALLDSVLNDTTLRLDVFAYDLNEPDIMLKLLQLARQGRVRIILDNASLHHSPKLTDPEDKFELEFNKAKTKSAGLLRGHFSGYSHDKVMIVSDAKGAQRVLTGSTNFSITGLYVNSNHVLVFNDALVAAKYSEVFEAAWSGGAQALPFRATPLATQEFHFQSATVPLTDISFAPHSAGYATSLMDALSARVKKEAKHGKLTGSVLFAVMDLATGGGSVRPTLIGVHANQTIFSYGISDSSKGMQLYVPKKKAGLLVTGRPGKTVLPAPFNQVRDVGIGHQIHHKFVICGFNSADAVVYCGSSNLADGGETDNGDNLLAIHDTDVATAFAIEAVLLVDHFAFLDRYAKAPDSKTAIPSAKQTAAAEAGWYLGVTDKWTVPYYDKTDLRCVDRELFSTAPSTTK